jgi:hypothetical protein
MTDRFLLDNDSGTAPPYIKSIKVVDEKKEEHDLALYSLMKEVEASIKIDDLMPSKEFLEKFQAIDLPKEQFEFMSPPLSDVEEMQLANLLCRKMASDSDNKNLSSEKISATVMLLNDLSSDAIKKAMKTQINAYRYLHSDLMFEHSEFNSMLNRISPKENE